MDDLELLVDLHLPNPRQGPGSDEETRRAIELARFEPQAQLDVLDVGCGTGASTLTLARTLNARVFAVDAQRAFIDRLRQRAMHEGLSDRIVASVGQMESLELADQRFDAIWSEGAIYNIGFAEGLRAWRRLLRPGGVVVVTEITWTTNHRPETIEAYWQGEYPSITTLASNLRTVEDAGYQPLAAFFLPPGCWEAEYFQPLRAGFAGFLERHRHEDAASRLVDAEAREMKLYRDYGQWYGYAFYIARLGEG